MPGHQQEFLQKQQNVSSEDEEIEKMKKEIQLIKYTQIESKHC